MVTTVLADCPECQREVEAKILDCDNCFLSYQDRGGDPNHYDELQHCPHLMCLECEERLDP
jgi:hypothetical protein